LAHFYLKETEGSYWGEGYSSYHNSNSSKNHKIWTDLKI